jgi:hypothetical protein
MTPPDDFDSWLEAELNEGFARSIVRSRAWADGYQRLIARPHSSGRVARRRRPLVGKAALASAAALALGTVGAAAATAVTHSVNPQAWGQQVENAVADCKAALSPGQHGIGECVSAFAKQHRSANSAGHGHGHGKKKSHPTVSPGSDNNAQPDTSNGHGGQPKSGKSQDPASTGTPDGQESPSNP